MTKARLAMRARLLFCLAAALVTAAPARAETRSLSALRAGNLDAAFRAMYADYPTARVVGGTLSMVAGGVTSLGGFLLMIDRSRPDGEGLVGAGLMLTGGASGLEGLIRTFRRSSAELLVPHYQAFPHGKPAAYGGDLDRIQYGEQTLERLSGEGRNMRFLRGALDGLTAAGYWYLHSIGDRTFDAAGVQTGNKLYPMLIVPAILFSVTAAYRCLFPSPEERAWSEYRSATTEGRRLDSSVTVDYSVAGNPAGGAHAILSVRFSGP